MIDLSDFFSECQLAMLGKNWIESADQIVAMTASAEGRSGLCDLLQIPMEELEAILKQLVKSMDAEDVERLADRTPGGKLGCLFEEGGKNKE